MGLIRYTAQRSLITPGTAGTTVDLEVGFYRWTPTREPIRRVTKVISGAKQSILDRIEVSYRAETTEHREADFPALEQWLDSVANSETFQINPTGSAASPGTLISVTMKSSSVPFRRIGHNIYRLSFEVERVVSS